MVFKQRSGGGEVQAVLPALWEGGARDDKPHYTATPQVETREEKYVDTNDSGGEGPNVGDGCENK